MPKIKESNKQIANSINAFLKRRDKLTRIEWQKNLRPLMRNAENEILTKLKSNTLTSWQLSNLNGILANINATIAGFNQQFKIALESGQDSIAEFTANEADKRLRFAKLNTPGKIFISKEALTFIQPLTGEFVKFFSEDMSKIISAQVSVGLATNQSINQVARNIRDKFKSSQMSFARANRIAATEMLTASSAADFSRGLEVQEINPTVRKVWIDSHKPNARRTHIATENRSKKKPKGMKSFFRVGSEKAQFPRDPRLSAKERVNCGCTLVYVNTKDKEGLSKLADSVIEQPDKLKVFNTGKFPTKELSKRQQGLNKFENSVRNNNFESGFIVDKNGKILMNRRGGKDFVQLTDSEARSLKGNIFSHNHPSGDSFTGDDIAVMIRSEAIGARAVTNEFNYVMKSNPALREFGADRVFKTWKNEYDIRIARITKKIKTGKITFDEGVKEGKFISHDIWTGLSKDFGFDYKREAI